MQQEWWRGRYPDLIYWAAAFAAYGWILSYSLPSPISLGSADRDIWQYLSAINALTERPFAPANPFVPGSEPSRLFTPLFALAGTAGHYAGWTPVTAYMLVSAFNLLLLAGGLYAFGRLFFRTRWGPLALLIATLFGAWWPVHHTGNHAPTTLIEGTGYPAATLIGAGFLAWALTIMLLERPRAVLLQAGFVLLIALMIAQHQLGAGIALVGVGAFGLLWPAPFRRRAIVAGLTVAGLLLAALWPYFNPYEAMASVGDPRWRSTGYDFYGWRVNLTLFIPSIIGLAWLRKPMVPRGHDALALMGAIYLGLWMLGLFGQPVAHRFVFPLVLVLQILLAAGLLRMFAGGFAPARAVLVAGWAAITLAVTHTLLLPALNVEPEANYLAAAKRLTQDLPAGSLLAGHGVASGPLTAAGRKVLAPALPEPYIADLQRRLALNDRLFAAGTSAEQRRALARQLGVSALFIEEKHWTPGGRQRLYTGARSVRRVGSYARIDP